MQNKLDKPGNLPGKSSTASREAREQATEYDSLFRPTPLELDDGSIIKIPPHPDFGMLDDEQMGEYEELLFDVETYDREDDVVIPEQRLDNGRVLPAEVKRGELKRPYRKDGQLVKPPYSVRVVMAALGDSEYKRLREGGRSAADVWRIWGQQGLDVRARQEVDSKSSGGDVALASVPEADSQ